MVSKLLARGLLAGLLAGILAFGFATTFGEPQVDKAIAFEAAMDKAKGDAPETELVGRNLQSSYGLATGVLVYGTAVGGIFSLVFAYSLGRSGQLSPRALSALIALAAFIAIAVLPDLKYPANPPSIGRPETIGERTGVFFIMMCISIATVVLGINLARALTARLGAWNAWLMAIAAAIVVIGVADYLLPAINEVPPDFSAVVLWKFRVSSLGIHAVIWAGVGLIFGFLVERNADSQVYFTRSAQ